MYGKEEDISNEIVTIIGEARDKLTTDSTEKLRMDSEVMLNFNRMEDDLMKTKKPTKNIEQEKIMKRH